MKKLLTLLITLSILQTVYPCGNEYGYALDGTRIYTRYFFLSERMLHFDTTRINTRLEKLYKKTENGSANYKDWSDIAANLMRIGKADSGIKILIPLLKEHPNEYNLIANLGTCYELTGQLDSALKYISKGYDINPKSHNGSEWIHIKILEAKIKEKRNPGWMKSNPVITLEELLERVPNEPKHLKSRKINRDFFYQIRTRVRFTPAPNRTIANLLTTLGEYNQEVGTYENALLAYTYALIFEASDYLDRKIKAKIKTLNQQRDKQPKITELPDMFIKMMKRSELDPEILLLGIDDFAEQLDSVHLVEVAQKDTLSILKLHKDSLENVLANEAKKQQHQLAEEESKKYIYLAIGLLIGLVVAIVLWRMKKN